MLLVGAFVGRPGGLIALGIVATLALGITSGVEASTDWEQRSRTRAAMPLTAPLTVQDNYSVPNGEILLDLTRVRDIAALDGREIDVHLNAGEIDVTLPPGLNADVDADMRFAGDISIDGSTAEASTCQLNRTLSSGSTTRRPDHHPRHRRPRRPDHRRPELTRAQPRRRHHVRHHPPQPPRTAASRSRTSCSGSSSSASPGSGPSSSATSSTMTDSRSSHPPS